MSTQYNVYVGPYIQVYNPSKTPSGPQYYRCENPNCVKYNIKSSNKYCSNCGSLIVLSPPSMERIEFDVYNEFNESLSEIDSERSNKNYQYFISNISPINIGNRYSSDCECEITSFQENVIADDLKLMSDTYKKEIAKLKEVFGDDDAVVRWGIITYYS